MIKQWHKMYDKLQEPWRFLAFFVPACLLFAGTAAGNAYVSAACWIALMIALVSRMAHIHKWY